MNRRELLATFFTTVGLVPSLGVGLGIGMGLSSCVSHNKLSGKKRNFVATKAPVHNRGRAPDDFLSQLIEWAADAPDEIFEKNDAVDIYLTVYPELGPWENLDHRKAVMLEVLRVLAGFESSWNWQEGMDRINPASNTSCTAEAGIFQSSGDSMNFHPELQALLYRTSGRTDCAIFREVSKLNHVFAIEYCARLLRVTVNHHGPVKHKAINRWLSSAAVDEFKMFLSQENIDKKIGKKTDKKTSGKIFLL